jgi:hypothetical protein
MNKRIRELALQAGCVLHGLVWVANDADLEHFAELMRLDERERIKQEDQRCYVERKTE